LLAHGADPKVQAFSARNEKVETPDSILDQRIERRQTALDLAMKTGDPLTRILERAGGQHGPNYREAESFNKKGFALHESGRFREAARFFERAVAASDLHYTAQFNLACATARLAASKNNPPSDRKWFDRSIQALQTAAEMNRERTIKKAASDPDFDGIRGYPRFVELITGTTFHDARDVAVYVVDKTFQTSCPGSEPCPIRSLTLHADRTWYETTNGGYLGDQGFEPVKAAPRSGRWTLEGRVVVLYAGRKVVDRLDVLSPNQVGDLYWPNPNDMSDEPHLSQEDGSSCRADP
jgi:tetratricopeptide (TPR) repeat protein